jgi:hypothetical protein
MTVDVLQATRRVSAVATPRLHVMIAPPPGQIDHA